ncbi:MAG: ferric reductase-like transmembrane domain-containing protein [Gammaproteobacteria bacterium]|nr:ferric reductase-like transmembrane domain-containing protein [Gammaproteobacteria bacterium]MDH4254790.1 ferric reductase-like transmembrane domain-containing protein [Gammaproteobacteria bacterium]MDH5310786.1 ferric reductase-like transmembrane domain-containing protein [Gammaproteobacteria bacterium]
MRHRTNPAAQPPIRPAIRPAIPRYLLWLALAMPFGWMLTRYRAGELYYGEVVHLSGELSVRLMMLAMAATPLLLMFPGRAAPRWLMRNRRYFGVASFAYAGLHTAVYADRTGIAADIVAEAATIEYLTGWVALLIFLALAATSNDRSVRWLRDGWKRLHRWVYGAAVLSFLHWVLVAFDPLPAYLHLALLAALEAYRLHRIRLISRRRGPAPPPSPADGGP